MKRKSILKWILLARSIIFVAGSGIAQNSLPAVKDLPLSINDSLIAISFKQADYLSEQQYRYAEQVIVRGVVEQQLSHCDSLNVALKKQIETYQYLNREFMQQESAFKKKFDAMQMAIDVLNSEVRKQKRNKIIGIIAGSVVGISSGFLIGRL